MHTWRGYTTASLHVYKTPACAYTRVCARACAIMCVLTRTSVRACMRVRPCVRAILRFVDVTSHSLLCLREAVDFLRRIPAGACECPKAFVPTTQQYRSLLDPLRQRCTFLLLVSPQSQS